MLLKSTAFLAIFVILVTGEVKQSEVKHRENIVEKEKRHHEHEEDVDHESFLGKDHGHDYDDMDEDESKAKLAALLPKVDADGDGDIDETELKNWIKKQIMDYVQKDAQNALPNEDTDKDGIVTWEEYVTNTFGAQYLNKEAGKEAGKDDDDDSETYAKYVKRDKQRFELADQDDDMKLTFEEFTAFLHPEEFEHMADVVIAETMEDMDENNDGKISLSEYVGEMDDENEEDDDDDWLEREKKSFQENKDKDHDGYLSKEELAAWIVPSEINYSLEEAQHLIQRADTNQDGVLSYQEVIEHHEVFVGSQATDYGRILHEEL